VLAATVRASRTRDGDPAQALRSSLPAETTTVTPALTTARTASSRLLLAEPPRLMLATAGAPGWWFLATQSSPAMTCEVLPEP
jgi:hypothetical protein